MIAAHCGEARCIRIGDWVLDLGCQQLKRDSVSHPLNPKEMGVLLHLASASPDLVSTDELLDHSWSAVIVGDHVLHEVVGRLRRMLGDSAHRPVYIETLRKRGYRMIAPVRGLSGGRHDEDDEQLDPLARTCTVAVLPFEDLSPAQDRKWLSGRLRESLLAHLSRIDQLKPIRASYPLEHYGDAILAGKRLGAQTLIHGSVFLSGDSSTLTIQVVETRSGTLLWSADFVVSGSADDPQIPLDTVVGIEATLGMRPPASSAEPLDYARYGTRDGRAYALWRKQLELKFAANATTKDLINALALCRQAVELDPQYVMGHVGLGVSHLMLVRRRSDFRDVVHARRAFERAVEIGPRHPVALANLALMAGYHRDWARVVHLVEQAEPWPAVAAARGVVQTYVWSLVNLGRGQAAKLALDEIMRIMEIAPDRYYALNVDVAEAIFWTLGDAAAAVEVLGRHGLDLPSGTIFPPTPDAPPGSPPVKQLVQVHPRVAFLYYYAGWEETAVEVFLRGVSRTDGEAARRSYKTGGWDAMLRKVAENRRSRAHPDPDDPAQVIATADMLAALGECEALFECLERQQALFERYLEADPKRVHECGRVLPDTFRIPVWTAPPYRRYLSEPRFQALLERYGVVCPQPVAGTARLSGRRKNVLPWQSLTIRNPLS